MKKYVIYFICFSIAFLGTTYSCTSPVTHLSQSIIKENKTFNEVSSTNGVNDSFISSNNFYGLNQNSENVRLSNYSNQLSVRTIFGFDKLFQLISFSKKNNRKYIYCFFAFNNHYSKRQMTGYYFYHLRKILI